MDAINLNQCAFNAHYFVVSTGLKSLLEGPAARAIQGLTLSKANYDSAIGILRERFGKTQAIITAHMEELLKLL